MLLRKFRTRHYKLFEKQKQQLKQQRATCSLIELQEGEKAVINCARGGFGVARRLAEMGLTPGCEVKLLRKCSFHGPLEVEVRNVAIALGHGIASKIRVQPLKAKLDEK